MALIYDGPVADIGILGGGQLALMLCEAATKMGLTTLVWAQHKDDPAVAVASRTIIGPFDDKACFVAFSGGARAVTTESENVPVRAITYLNKIAGRRNTDLRYMHPSPSVQLTAADRKNEKDLCRALGIDTAPYIALPCVDLHSQNNYANFPFPAILKTRKGGYDGHGQHRVANWAGALAAHEELNHVPCILEGVVNFVCEFSIIVARDRDNNVATYPAIENVHKDGILIESRCPAQSVTRLMRERGNNMVRRLANSMGLTGIMAVEMFGLPDQRVYVNEVAPRPHNSGHGTIEGNTTSQFAMLLDILVGNPLGSTELIAPWTMTNFLGMTESEMRAATADDEFCHPYGKKEAKAGRKMGHKTKLDL